ncbi:hypothetical protein PHLGIDRAFT_19071 [Phlebiopsis gigantea 11061_1 CR5-6]|uniref:Uncharacterized protein n=1 Tax=Phlebiopsis gigantea (strain 11061_1 CR5-6) TaxID=745531 RepID=A0A0C3NRV4_PHLG1|nr:hypothetical protein PHLGIDRAFT_19071 [Phlebiopsis gigantea 11061_1 CR5-6]
MSSNPNRGLSTEVLCMILSHLSIISRRDPRQLRGDLANVCLASRLMCSLATPLLFRDLRFTFRDSPNIENGGNSNGKSPCDTDCGSVDEFVDTFEECLERDSRPSTRSSVITEDHDTSGEAGQSVRLVSGTLSEPGEPNASGYLKNGLQTNTEIQRKTFQGFYDFLVDSPSICAFVERLSLGRHGPDTNGKASVHVYYPDDDIPESLLLDICHLLPHLKALALTNLLTQCEDPQGPLPMRLLSLDVLRLDMHDRYYYERMLDPLRLVCHLKHLIIGPIIYSPDTNHADTTPLDPPTISSRLSIESLLFVYNEVIFHFLPALVEKENVLKNLRNLRLGWFDPDDLDEVCEFLDDDENSVRSLSMDMRAMSLFTPPDIDGEAEKDIAPMLGRIESLVFMDMFVDDSGSLSPSEISSDGAVHSWEFIYNVLVEIADSEHLQRITIVAREEEQRALPSKRQMSKHPEGLEPLLLKIDELHLPALREFKLVSAAVLDDSDIQVAQEAFPRLHERGVLVVEEVYPVDYEVERFNVAVYLNY